MYYTIIFSAKKNLDITDINFNSHFKRKYNHKLNKPLLVISYYPCLFDIITNTKFPLAPKPALD